MSFHIEDYPEEVESHPSGEPYTLDVRPVSESGIPLRGALVKYLSPKDLSTTADTFDGTSLASFDARGGDVPRGFVAVYHYGRRVSSSVVEEGALTQTGGRTYRMELEGGSSNAPEEFGGIVSSEWVGDELVCTWRPPRHKSAGVYAISASLRDQKDELFTAHHDNIRANWNNAFMEVTNLGYDDPVEYGEKYKDWVMFQTWADDYDGMKALLMLTDQDGASYVQMPIKNQVFEDGKTVLGSRTQRTGQPRAKDNFIKLPKYQEPTYDTGPNVTGVTITPDPGTVVQGDAYILEAAVSGDGDHDPTVSWDASGPTLVKTGPRRCLVEADQSGTVTATSNKDGSLSDSIQISAVEYPATGTPTAPSGVSWRNARPPGTAEISWDDTASPMSHYRLYLAESESGREFSPHLDTYRARLRVGDLSLGTTYYAGVVAVHPDGNESDMVTFEITPEDISGEKAGRRVVPPKAQRLTAGGSRTVDLSGHVHLTATNTASSQTGLWQEASITVRRVSEDSPISASVSGSEVTFSAESGASTGYGPEPVLIKIANGARAPVWIGTMVSVSSSAGEGPPQITDLQPEDLSSIDAERVVGANPSALGLGEWEPKIERVAHVAGISVENGMASVDPESYGGGGGSQTVGGGSSDSETGRRGTGTNRDGTPAIAALSGDNGSSLIVVSREPESMASLPQMPSGTISKAEKTAGNWSSLPSGWKDELGPGSPTERWLRALTSGGTLHSLSMTEPPEELRYEAPTYFQDYWLDENQYPSGAELDPEKGAVVYRGGLESPTGSPTEPTVESLQAQAGPERVWVDWTVSLGGETREGLTLPVEIWPQGSPSESSTQTGTGTATFTDVTEGVTHVVGLFGTQDTATPLNPEADVEVIGYANGDGTYTYEYDVDEDDLQSWTDHFGTSHNPGSNTVTSPDAIDLHSISLSWANETRERTVETEWRLPPGPVSFEKQVQTGQSILARRAEPPAFSARRFAGEREVQLAYNAYGAGTWEVHPVGYLPLSAEGELEDYVVATFIGPGGDEMGQSVQLSRATEMAVQLSVEAAGSLSPIIYGARVEQSS